MASISHFLLLFLPFSIPSLFLGHDLNSLGKEHGDTPDSDFDVRLFWPEGASVRSGFRLTAVAGSATHFADTVGSRVDITTNRRWLTSTLQRLRGTESKLSVAEDAS